MEFSAEQTQQALHQSVFMSSLTAHPFRDLPLGREQHCKLLPGVADIQAGEVARWTVDELYRQPHSYGLSKIENTTIREDLREQPPHGRKKTRPVGLQDVAGKVGHWRAPSVGVTAESALGIGRLPPEYRIANPERESILGVGAVCGLWLRPQAEKAGKPDGSWHETADAVSGSRLA
ncbi:Lethal(3)malignant brain tumor-like protein 4 [Galemys pyrenaicus]|uniref:Lethal(3)malignant brain tumor-like protein 4 n=1 Tax=Galemys pyrenaicus TaxID=202257 RepID=A0A8J6AHJ2_GALPY|nr:Lethal(3)malignant brain tumor-like protein 4 [Galemys pyrenaicus]